MIPASSSKPKAKSRRCFTQPNTKFQTSLHKFLSFGKQLVPSCLINVCKFLGTMVQIVLNTRRKSSHHIVSPLYSGHLGVSFKLQPFGPNLGQSILILLPPCRRFAPMGDVHTQTHTHLDSSERAHSLSPHQAPTDSASYCRG